MSRFLVRLYLAVAATACLALLASSGAARAQAPRLKAPEHDLLKKEVGVWDATMKLWLSPDAEPLTVQCVEKNELLPGGMWLLSEFKSESPELSFSGKGALGYEPVEKKFVHFWIDSMSPYAIVLKGDYDPNSKTLRMTGESRDPQSGEMQTTRHVAKYVDDDTRVFEIYMVDDDGDNDEKVVEIQYKRRK